VIEILVQEHRLSVLRACRTVRLSRAAYYRPPIERFNRSYRTEVLNAHLFDSPADLQALTDAWLRTYNHERPHDSLGRRPPLTFLPRPSSAAQSTNALSA
jgi:transposase InsO family protein